LPLFGVSTASRAQLLEDFIQPLVIHASQNVAESDNHVDQGAESED
jgi:hypothetical protein